MLFSKRLIFSISCVFFFSFSVLAQAPNAQSKQTKTLTPNKIQLALNWKAEAEFGGFYEGNIKNFYKEKSLDVSIIEGGSGAPVPQLVASKKVEFGIVTGDEIIVAQARGMDIVALFAVYQIFPQGIMTHEARGFKSLEDVFNAPGLLALQKGAPFALYLEKKYAKNKKVKVVPFTGGVAPFIKNSDFSQQCFVTSEPLSARKMGKAAKTFAVADSGYNPYTAVVIAHRDFIKKNPDLVDRFLKATQLGWDSYLKDPKAANDFMRKLNPSIEEDIFQLSSEVQVPFIVSDETKTNGTGFMTSARWEELGKQLVDVGVIKAKELKSASSYFEWRLPSK